MALGPDELRRLWFMRRARVWTHRSPDVDALFSIALWARLIDILVDNLKINFVPADTHLPSGVVGLDLMHGYKGERSSCFEELCKLFVDEIRQMAVADSAIVPLAHHISGNDQGNFHGLDPIVRRGMLPGFFSNLNRSEAYRNHQRCALAEAVLIGALQTSGIPSAPRPELLLPFERYRGENRQLLAPIEEHISMWNEGGLDEAIPRVRAGLLGPIFSYLEAAGVGEIALREYADNFVLGFLRDAKARREAESWVDDATRRKDGRILVLGPGHPQIAVRVAFEHDERLRVIAFQPHERNIGIIRRSDLKRLNLAELLADELPRGFYCDPRGFICVWGAAKAPAVKPCPLTIDQVVSLLERKLDEIGFDF